MWYKPQPRAYPSAPHLLPTAADLEAANDTQGLSTLPSILDFPHPWLAPVTDNKLSKCYSMSDDKNAAEKLSKGKNVLQF